MSRLTDPVTAVLAAQVLNMEVRLARANVLQRDMVGVLIVGPDDLEHDPEIVRFGGFEVLRVDHWQGEPVVGVPAGATVADAYHVARAMLEQVSPRRIRAFGPPGWERVSVPFMLAKNGRLDFVPADGLAGPVIGVELT